MDVMMLLLRSTTVGGFVFVLASRVALVFELVFFVVTMPECLHW